jgi:alkaline phosphatase D
MFFLFCFIVLISTPILIHSQTLADRQKTNDIKYFICDIMEGNFDKVINDCNLTIQKDSTDLEAFFGLSVAYGQKGDNVESFINFKKTLQLGLPFERFLAGPRKLLHPLVNSRRFIEYAKDKNIELIHGPMIGVVTENSAKVWIRTVSESSFNVRFSTSEDMKNSRVSIVRKTSPERDFTGVAELSGLLPNTRYYYELIINKNVVEIDPQPSFQTYPKSGSKEKFKVIFGGGSNNIPKNERVWDTILSQHPMAFLFLGDNTYFNIADVVEHQRYIFYRRFSRPEFRRLAASTAIYAIYDDHDFCGNDCIGGPEIDNPPWKKNVTWRIFKENFLNPYYGGGEQQPGCWHHFSIGDVDFFMLDGRYYRTDPQKKEPLYTDPKAEYPSMLGPVQRRWLLEKLRTSKATFKIIASPVPWAFDSKSGTQRSANLGRRPGAEDTWQGFAIEREVIFSHIEKNKIEGVFLLSADRHRSDAWKIERQSGYTLYEASSSHLTKNSTHPHMPQAIFSILGKPAFGMLTFDFTKDDPEIIYQVVKIDNEIVAELVVKRSQLSF